MKKSDVIIVGTGIAGLSLALHLIEKNKALKIVLLAKGYPCATNTSLAQGGLAVVCDRLIDSYEEHIQDTLAAGQGKCNPEIVEMVIKQAPQRLQELIKWGAEFDADREGKLDLALEGGHSHERVVHYKDKTGWHIQEVLWNKIKSHPSIEIIDNALAVDIIKENIYDTERAVGLTFFDRNNQFSAVYAPHIVMATGGSGHIFNYTSNPENATGDGVAMALRAGVSVKDMQYVQFHPTALFEKKKGNLFLISEALRGFGAHVVNYKEERFLYHYDVRGELATRDIVSKAIATEMIISNEENVFLDLRHLNNKGFEIHFPTIFSNLKEKGFDYKIDLIPIVPAAHYQCGGIEVNENGETSLKNLYALGECSCTGLHGANRLASNSLIEALVFSHNVAEVIAHDENNDVLYYEHSHNHKPEFIAPTILKDFNLQVKNWMTFSLLTNSFESKQIVLSNLHKIHSDLMECLGYYNRCKECCELENMLDVAMLILEHSCQYQGIESEQFA